MRQPAPRRLLPVLGILALLIACSDDDGGAEAVATTTTSTTSSTAAPEPVESVVASTAPPAPTVSEVETDFGVSDEAIRVGLSADLSGPFAGVAGSIVDAHITYFDRVNVEGGIGGRPVELLVLDNTSNVDAHLDNYAEFAEESEHGVVMIGYAGTAELTAAIAPALVEDDLAAVSLSRWSGWSGPVGTNVFELHASTCVEAMNGVEFLAERVRAGQGAGEGEGLEREPIEAPTLAIVSGPDRSGGDSMRGARIAARELELEIVYDGAGAVTGEAVVADVVEALVTADPDIVWLATSPRETALILAGSVGAGLEQALWSGNGSGYDAGLLETAVAEFFGGAYIRSSPVNSWGAPATAASRARTVLIDDLPTASYVHADSLLLGWAQAMFVDAVLRAADASGDLTRTGVLDAAAAVTVDFDGLAPEQAWAGSASELAVTGTYLFDVDLATATPATAISEAGGTGLRLLSGPWVGSVAARSDMLAQCFVERLQPVSEASGNG